MDAIGIIVGCVTTLACGIVGLAAFEGEDYVTAAVTALLAVAVFCVVVVR